MPEAGSICIGTDMQKDTVIRNISSTYLSHDIYVDKVMVNDIDFMAPLHQHGLITDKEFSVLQKSDHLHLMNLSA